MSAGIRGKGWLTWVAHGRPNRVGMLVIHSSQDNRHNEALQSSKGLRQANKGLLQFKINPKFCVVYIA